MDSDIFSRLSRLNSAVRENAHNGGSFKGDFRFMIKISGDVSTIDIVDATQFKSVTPDTSNLAGPRLALVRAIESARKESGNSVWSRKAGVSLIDNPFLCWQLNGVDGIIDSEGNPIRNTDDPGRLVLEVIFDDTAHTAHTALTLQAGDSSLRNLTFLSDSCILADGKLHFIDSVGEGAGDLTMFNTEIGEGSLPLFLSIFLSCTENIGIVSPNMRVVRPQAVEEWTPTLMLEKVDVDKSLYMSLIPTTDDIDPEAGSRFSLRYVVRIDRESCRIIVKRIRDIELTQHAEELERILHKCAPNRDARKEIYREGNFFIVPEATAGPFLIGHLNEMLTRFRVLGTDRLKDYKVKAVTPKLNVRLSSGIDFLEGEADVEIEDQKMTLADLIAQYDRNRFVQLSDGTRAVVDDRYVRSLERLFRKRDKNGKIKVSFFDLPEIDALLQGGVEGKAMARSRKFYSGFNTLSESSLPKIEMNVEFRNYQKEGVKWLKYLYDNSLGGCLADDMGLGKTVQTIALLAMTTPKAEKPSLIVVPKSLVFNWQNEFARFAPGLDVGIYYGADRDLGEALKHKIILTTYAMVRNDVESLRDKEFDMVVLDESQTIKNVNALQTKAVWLLNADHRLALSGTPLENNLTELYSLFRFLNPGMFGTVEEFNNLYTNPIQRNADEGAMLSLRRKIFPFILRRLKKDVVKDLPDRIEQTIYVEMDPAQKSLYERRRVDYLRQVREAIGRDGVAGSQFVMFQALSELRQIASIPESRSDGRIASPKVENLLEQVTSAVENGHKTVVFFNFLQGMELVGERLEKLGIGYEVMSGATRDRKKVVERFQTDPDCMVLLLTLKVGGVGLNLTAADTVFIFEPWWNKAAEEQAINRLHRIGQKSTVNAYRLITSGTIEEKILELQQKKQELFDGLIGTDGTFSKQLTEEDINFILS